MGSMQKAHAVTGSRRTRVWRSTALILATATLALANPSLAPAAVWVAPVGSVTLTLAPIGPTTIPLGEPFTARATATNQGGLPVAVHVRFDVAPAGDPGSSIAVSSWDPTIPAGGSAEAIVTLTTAQWFGGPGPFLVTATTKGAGHPSIGLAVGPPSVTIPTFQDIAPAVGIATTLPLDACGQRTAGAAWADVDADGDLDLYVTSRTGVGQLWIDDGAGHYTDQAAARGVQDEVGFGGSPIFVDEDGDGDQDLYLSNIGPNALFRNDGAGHFVDVTAQAGVGDAHASSSSSWGDFDRDGDLDLYVANNVECSLATTADRLTYEPDTLYRNEGDGTYTDVTSFIGAEKTLGSAFQALWFDADGDGDQDLYLANDYTGSQPDGNHLFRNDGPGPGGTWRFTDVSASSGTDLEINSMGIALGDVDGDGDLDLAISNIHGNVLLSNDGDGTFTDVPDAAGTAAPDQRDGVKAITWGLGFQDLNLDTWPDLVVAAGALHGEVDQPDQAFVNDGTGRFLNVTAPAGLTDPAVGRGAAFADVDGDGLVDVFIVNAGAVARLYRNTTSVAGRHWLGVRLTGAGMDTDACGALVTVTVAGRSMLQQVLCGDSLGAGSERTLHFGLGGATKAQRIEVRWPDGTVTIRTKVRADRTVEIAQTA